MCEDNKLKLIPIVIIVAALLSGLIILSYTPAGLFVAFAAGLGTALFILIVTGHLTSLATIAQA
jgi:hypothetical protein